VLPQVPPSELLFFSFRQLHWSAIFCPFLDDILGIWRMKGVEFW
jgi:hypothetical protein